MSPTLPALASEIFSTSATVLVLNANSLAQPRALKVALGAEMVKKLQCRRPEFDPWVGKFPWRREWQHTAVFLPGKSHGQRSLLGCSPGGHIGLVAFGLLPAPGSAQTMGPASLSWRGIEGLSEPSSVTVSCCLHGIFLPGL